MNFIVSQCYEIVTEESAEQGDADERGFEFQDEEYDLRSLIRHIQNEGFCWTSNSDGTGWLETEPGQDVYTGAYESKSLHIKTSNRNLKRIYTLTGIRN